MIDHRQNQVPGKILHLNLDPDEKISEWIETSRENAAKIIMGGKFYLTPNLAREVITNESSGEYFDLQKGTVCCIAVIDTKPLLIGEFKYHPGDDDTNAATVKSIWDDFLGPFKDGIPGE